MSGIDGKPGSIILRVDDSVLALFGTDSVFSVVDADRSITYILSGRANVSVAQREASTVPSQPVPGLPEKFRLSRRTSLFILRASFCSKARIMK